jgi:hypothetical protein
LQELYMVHKGAPMFALQSLSADETMGLDRTMANPSNYQIFWLCYTAILSLALSVEED